MDTITIYGDMTLKELQEEFGKSASAVSMAVKRMLDRNPDHPEWKMKDGRTTIIKSDGVSWLSEYFRINEIAQIDEEKIKLQAENDYLRQLVENLNKQYEARLQLELEKQATEFNSKRLLEQKDTEILEQRLKAENEALQKELDAFKPSMFGFYRKK